jgi:hypothetical protein
MVPLTIFQRLSSLGSGGGVNASTIPPVHGTYKLSKNIALKKHASNRVATPVPCLLMFYGSMLAFIRDHGHVEW